MNKLFICNSWMQSMVNRSFVDSSWIFQWVFLIAICKIILFTMYFLIYFFLRRLSFLVLLTCRSGKIFIKESLSDRSTGEYCQYYNGLLNDRFGVFNWATTYSENTPKPPPPFYKNIVVFVLNFRVKYKINLI